MKIEQAHIDKIRAAFQNMQSREDLLHLLNEVKPLVYGEKSVPFQLKQLTWYSNPKLAKRRYTEFKVKKKSGDDRTINAPVANLKAIQKVLNIILQCIYEPNNATTGFVKDKSIVDNAKIHIGSKYVYNIDLKDFFTSIDQARVWKCLQLKPFNLNDKNFEVKETIVSKIFSFDEIRDKFNFTHARIINTSKGEFLHLVVFNEGKETYMSIKIDKSISFRGISTEEKIGEIKDDYIVLYYKTDNGSFLKLRHKTDVKNVNRKIIYSRLILANIIASLCCIKSETKKLNKKTGEEEFQYVLPQGAPTSPVISNIICQRLDYLLSAVAKRFGLKYSRYADDITFSSMHNVYQSDSEFLKELQRIITDQGFQIKESKTRLQKEGYRQEVTGLLVNEDVNVQKRYIKQLRMWLYYWETYGVTRAENYFLKQYIADKDNIVKGKPNMVNVLEGKLNFLKMVKGDENELYLKLKERFDKLTSKQSFISKVLHIWETNGIESAMKLYYSKDGEQPANNSNDDFEFTTFDTNKFLDNQSL